MRRGSLPRSPVSWSVVVMMQRLQGPTGAKDDAANPTIRPHTSSANAGQPVTTRLGRKRFIGGAGCPCVARRWLRSPSENLADNKERMAVGKAGPIVRVRHTFGFRIGR